MRALAIFLLVSTAHAYCPPAERPPAQFDRPLTIPLFEYAVPRSQINATCKRVFFGIGCPEPVVGKGYRIVTPDGSYCAIVYLENCPAIRRHEVAHCQGWRH